MIALYFIVSSIIGVSFFYTADYFLTKWERKQFAKKHNKLENEQ